GQRRATAAAHRRRRGCRGAGLQPGDLAQPLLHQVAEGAIGNLRQQRPRALGQPRPAGEGGQGHALGQGGEEKLRQRRGLLPSRIRGSTDSTAFHAAPRPARSPSKQKYTSGALRNSSSACSDVVAVPSVATAWVTPCSNSAITSM